MVAVICSGDLFSVFVSECQCRDLKGLASLLMRVYPEHKWDIDKLVRQSGPIKSSQRILYCIVQELYPTEGTNNLCHSSL